MSDTAVLEVAPETLTQPLKLFHAKSKTILVTGGTGFVGSNLARELANEGHDVLITGREEEQEMPDFNITSLEDWLSNSTWERHGPIDALFHQAAITNTLIDDEQEMHRVNVELSQELFRKAALNGCRKIVWASSTAIYGDAPSPYVEGQTVPNPLNAYGRSKLAFERWVKNEFQKRTDATVVGLRYCNIYGPGEEHKGIMASMIYQLYQQMRTGNPKVFKFGEHKRDMIYVDDVVKLNIAAAMSPGNLIVNGCSGEAHSFNEVIKILNQEMLRRRIIDSERRTQWLEFSDKGVDPKKYQELTEGNMDLAKEKLRFTPTMDLEAGIVDYIDYLTGF